MTMWLFPLAQGRKGIAIRKVTGIRVQRVSRHGIAEDGTVNDHAAIADKKPVAARLRVFGT
jgi:hypothetical protein